jgi:hypothetical protein
LEKKGAYALEMEKEKDKKIEEGKTGKQTVILPFYFLK